MLQSEFPFAAPKYGVIPDQLAIDQHSFPEVFGGSNRQNERSFAPNLLFEATAPSISSAHNLSSCGPPPFLSPDMQIAYPQTQQHPLYHPKHQAKTSDISPDAYISLSSRFADQLDHFNLPPSPPLALEDLLLEHIPEIDSSDWNLLMSYEPKSLPQTFAPALVFPPKNQPSSEAESIGLDDDNKALLRSWKSADGLYDCPCGKKFARLCGLRSHIKTHLSKSHYLAPVPRTNLDEAVSGFQWFDRTGKALKNVIPAPRLECPTCKKSFLRPQDLRRHRYKHERGGRGGTTVTGKSLKCKVCSAEFSRSDALFKHVNGNRCRGPEIAGPRTKR